MISIVDYGMGNIGSIRNMFTRIGVDSTIVSSSDAISAATKILLPGVGAFDAAMNSLQSNGLVEIITRKALVERVPILGICLGMQLLTKSSEEGEQDGLGLFDGYVVKFRDSPNKIRIPHMGWNSVVSVRESKLIENLPADPRFYFVHSYYVHLEDETQILCKTNYGVEFPSIIQRDNIFGAQFHPEKSHKYGMKLLSNFASI